MYASSAMETYYDKGDQNSMLSNITSNLEKQKKKKKISAAHKNLGNHKMHYELFLSKKYKAQSMKHRSILLPFINLIAPNFPDIKSCELHLSNVISFMEEDVIKFLHKYSNKIMHI